MRIAAFLILGLVLLVIQTSFFQGLPEWIGTPDLLFILIVFTAIYLELGQGLVLVVLFGTAVEVLSGYFLGLYILAYVVTFSLIRAASKNLAIKETAQQPAITACSYLFANGLVYISTAMLAAEDLSPWSWGLILQRVLILTILTIPMNLLLHLVLEQCDRKHERRSFFAKRKYRQGNRYRPQKRTEQS